MKVKNFFRGIYIGILGLRILNLKIINYSEFKYRESEREKIIAEIRREILEVKDLMSYSFQAEFTLREAYEILNEYSRKKYKKNKK